jgi:hypothetical protein
VNEPLSQDKYYGACLIRHPELRKDLLAFHQNFPLLFQGPSSRSSALPKQVQPLIHAQGDKHVMAAPQTFNDLPFLYSLSLIMALHRAGYRKEVCPEDGREYFQTMHIRPSQWRHAWDRLRHQWSMVPEPFLRYCRLSDVHRLSWLVPVEPFSQEAWTASVARAALDVKLMIPVYADTTLEE